MKSIVLACLLLAPLVTFGGFVDRSHYVDDGGYDMRDSQFGLSFDWSFNGPLEFLDLLKVSERCVTVTGQHYGWIQEEDIPALISLLGSKERCAVVQSPLCSRLPKADSTVGHEAKLMIEGYRRGHYPYFLSSEGTDISVADERQFSEWCERFMAAHEKKAANQALQTTSVTRSGFEKVSVSDGQRRGV